MSAWARGPLQTMVPSSMNARVSATSSAFWACSSTRRTAQPRVAEFEDGAHDLFGGEGREAEGGFVGDEHDGRVGEGGGEAEHLLLAAGEEPGFLLAALGEDREPFVGLVAQFVGAEEDGEVLLDGEAGEDAAGFGDEQHSVAGAHVHGLSVVTSVPSRVTVPRVGSTSAGGDGAERGLAGSVGAEQRDDLARVEADVDAVEDFDVAVAGDDARVEHEGVRRRWRAAAPLRGSAASAVLVDGLFVGGHEAGVGLGFGWRRSRGVAFLGAAFGEFLVAGEGEDAVGFLGEVDGPEAGQDRARSRCEVTSALTCRRGGCRSASQWNTAVPAANANPASSAPPGRRMPNRTASASQNSPTIGGCGGVAGREAEHGRATRRRTRRSRRTRAKIMILERLARTPEASRGDFGAAHREDRPSRRRALQGVDHEGDEPEQGEEQQDLVGDLTEVEMARSCHCGWMTLWSQFKPGTSRRGGADGPAQLAVTDRVRTRTAPARRRTRSPAVQIGEVTRHPAGSAGNAMMAPSAAATERGDERGPEEVDLAVGDESRGCRCPSRG